LDKKVLRFSAVFSNPRPEDVTRSFLINYYLADETLSISEPPKRNTGIMGGKFLRRGKYKTTRGDYYQHSDFVVGNTIVVLGYEFKLLEADQYTLASMKSTIHNENDSNMAEFISKLALKLKKENVTMGKTFRLVDKNHSGYISITEIKNLLREYFADQEFTNNQLLSVMRYFDTEKVGRLEVSDFVKMIAEADVKRSSQEIGGGGRDIVIPEVDEEYAKKCAEMDMEDISFHLEDQVLFQFANHCKNRGIGLQNIFRIFDKDRSGTLEREEFKMMLHSEEIIPGHMTDREVSIITNYFFKNEAAIEMKEFREILITVFRDFEAKEFARIMHRGAGDVGF
jgi:Ca2+-binding EF-hand superfamily protein